MFHEGTAKVEDEDCIARHDKRHMCWSPLLTRVPGTSREDVPKRSTQMTQVI